MCARILTEAAASVVFPVAPAAESSDKPAMNRRGWSAEVVAAVTLLAALTFAAALAVAGFFVGRETKSTPSATVTTSATAATVDPQIAAGAHDFVNFACAQCHGLDGRGGVSPDVPALKAAAQLTSEELRGIIDRGLGVSANPSKPFMPVWGNVISAHQVDDLVAYIRAGLPAVPDATPVVIPQGQGPEVAGAALYVKYGCVNCHGPNGLGGVPNPQSEDKTIPPLSGADFFKEFNTDRKITDFVRTGSVLGRQPIVSMPHWGGIIPDADLQSLLAYIKTLKTT
jgi:mono/diheme cytochrome c family protein